MTRPRSKLLFTATLALAAGGCNTSGIINDGLAANDPSRLDAPAGTPPVPVASLAIAPTGLPPTATPKVQPDPVMPKMDNDFRTRSLPEGVAPTLPPATRASDLKDIPYGEPSFDNPSGKGRP